ncbi:MAG: ATP-binding protein [Desulfobacterales bacterium]
MTKTNQKKNVLIVDDEESMRFTLSKYLRDAGYMPYTAASIQEAEKQVDSVVFDVAIADRLLTNGANGLDLLENLRKKQPSCQTVLTGQAGDHTSHICLSVTDSGCGMDEETMQRIFEKYYTTKSASGGSGLGLYMAREIVRGYGGEIEVESSPGQGSTFRVLLPEIGISG